MLSVTEAAVPVMGLPFHEIDVPVNIFTDCEKEVIKHSCTLLCISCRDKPVKLAVGMD